MSDTGQPPQPGRRPDPGPPRGPGGPPDARPAQPSWAPAAPGAGAPPAGPPRHASAGGHATPAHGLPASAAARASTPPASTPPASTPPASVPPAGPAGTDETSRRPRWLVPVVVAGAVVVVGGVVAGVLAGQGAFTPAAPSPSTSTVVLASPTSTVDPVGRDATTAFASALPGTVLQYAVASSEEDAERVADGALEAWLETWTDGGDATLTVRAGQWETAEEAAAVADAVAQALPEAEAPDGTPSAGSTAGPALPATGDVLVDGETVGTYTVVDAGDGTGVAVWSNGTAVLEITGPVGQILDLYAAFPL
ncbi:hypothetical protein [Cellulomonas oligotrophica]|uniref:Uncharacterized protein n=1 Tax=Cellulomonas oligotrophica TaxID=931536 RepID=A0A7Y9FHC7_9CELL|nr:hypothetical protein [Cellulomonas oligotrophica]NYD87072.1 hypothetical protein [Cellulomonas oligotrophica]GIG32142.1 hypothetical protein Col01nite_13010 [Cellulomonas oligotrophica]